MFSLLLALLGGAAVGIGNSGSVGVGQQTTPNINATNQIDPSSIERAYAALGLTYQGNQMPTQTQAQVKSQQQGQSPQGLRPMNPTSKYIEDKIYVSYPIKRLPFIYA